MNTLFHHNIRFVLVEPSHPGNIGAVARAIKTMGFSQLVLVKPRSFPDQEASVRAAGAEDILEKCIVVDSLEEAIADCQQVIGTSVRDRRISWPVASPKETAAKVTNFLHSASGSGDSLEDDTRDSQDLPYVAVLFGRERTGLENHELDHAHWQIRIPANDEYNSLNLASAVQIIAYELNCAFIENDVSGSVVNEKNIVENAAKVTNVKRESSTHVENTALEKRQRLATHSEMHGFYQHLEEILMELDFIKANPPTKLLRKIIRLYNRSNVSVEELHILRGILTATQQKIAR